MAVRKWWQDAIIYEIYPRSYVDSNYDGIGDLMGIVSKLDYLQTLGINALWLCPVYETPNVDSGYDVADYYKIAKDLGTMKHMELLIEEAHKRGIKIIMELVANHTSNKHYWFIDALNKGKYRDFYIWKKGKNNGELPNNWMSSKTEKPVWTKPKNDDEYYLHLYTEAQPDLNWSNRELRTEIYSIMKFWLNKGVDGFRMDVINKIAKAEGLPDVPTNTPFLYGEMYFENYPDVHRYLKEMYEEVLVHYPDCLAMGQTSGVSPEQAYAYTNPSLKELNLFLQFEHVNIDYGKEGKKLEFLPKEFYDSIMKWQTGIDNKLNNTVFLGSHDLPRTVSHYGNVSDYLKESATMLATFQLLLKGTQVIYYGEEIGMTNVNYVDINDYIDTRSRSTYDYRINVCKDKVVDVEQDLRALARDNARYPMQWNNSTFSGFSSVKPWMKNCNNYEQINVECQLEDNYSVLKYYKWLISFKKTNATFNIGKIFPINDKLPEGIYGYRRVYNNINYSIICNFEATTVDFADETHQVSSLYGVEIDSNYIKLGLVSKLNKIKPYEVKIYKK